MNIHLFLHIVAWVAALMSGLLLSIVWFQIVLFVFDDNPYKGRFRIGTSFFWMHVAFAVAVAYLIAS